MNFQEPLMLENLCQAQNLALNDSHLLIVGESGTGKNTMAQYLQGQCSRHRFPYIRLNCTSLTEDLLDIELFGNKKINGVDIYSEKIGKMEQANQGVLLLDEIAELPLRLQAKLARALQTREIYKIGSEEPISINLRIFSTNHYSLKDKVNQGLFRSDLYYLLSAESVQLLPLRDRPEDLSSLSTYFLKKFSISLNKKKCSGFTSEALDLLKQSLWRGNIRELEHLIYRSFLHNETDLITVEVLKKSGLPSLQLNANMDLKPQKDILSYVGQTIAEVEKRLILTTLEFCKGNRTKAALLLGISIRTLRNKLNLYLPNNFKFEELYNGMQVGS